MDANLTHTWSSLKSVEDWILKLGLLDADQFIASTSSGSLLSYSLSNASSRCLFKWEEAHESSINDMKVIDTNTFASCSTDGIKVWDVRVTAGGGNNLSTSLNNAKNSNFLSLAARGNLLAGGTELQSADAEVLVWDLRKADQVVNLFVDSHQDDVTALEFHPSLEQYLMSGSTDGYTNIYDLSKPEEEDALHQVINFGSVHSCHFITESRISVLTHIETLMFHDLHDTNYEDLSSLQFVDVGDLRAQWPDNSYVIDLSPSGYVAFASTITNKLSVMPFNPRKEKFKLDKVINFPQAHGDQIVRDVLVLQDSRHALSCGEDGAIKYWEFPRELKRYSIGETTSPVEISPPVKKVSTKPHHQNKKSRKDKRFKPY
ncbi:uncharacterized protein LODBEIA_P09060 [Lodderomyces beijingensis]|uniref:WD repeat-containing protein 89 n=1 Tax=Lodderomyces beijingensis TaxID=1775926 RepID=A0ABP0ZH04_9ASCO